MAFPQAARTKTGLSRIDQTRPMAMIGIGSNPFPFFRLPSHYASGPGTSPSRGSASRAGMHDKITARRPTAQASTNAHGDQS
jgi:hypothetical protein